MNNTQEVSTIFELFNYPTNCFLEHLNFLNNDRIIFSGKFGHGKSTFLRHFFSNETQQKNLGTKKFNAIFLYPVNYSVSSNEDIFKYIKYDIILEMLRNNYPVKEETHTYIKTLQPFLKKNLAKVAAAIVYMIPQVGKDVVEAWDKLNEVIQEFIKEYDQENEGDKLIEFLEKLEASEGNIFEEDIITKLIQKVIQRKNGKGEESILIIDDLDRIDPEHIFRILNVFAAHFDRQAISQDSTKNKFGFDKILIVCDINNVRQIFAAKYGIETDFNGYIDKFFSNIIFDFKNVNSIAALASKSIQFKEAGHYTIDSYGKKLFGSILNLLLTSNSIDLRNILKWKTLQLTSNATFRVNGFEVTNSDFFPIVQTLRILAYTKGDYKGLANSIQSSHLNASLEAIDIIVGACLFLLTASQHRFPLNYFPFEGEYIINNIRLKYNFVDAGDNFIRCTFNEFMGKPFDRNDALLKSALIETIELLGVN